MVRMSTLEEWNFTDTSKQKPYGWKEVPVLQTNDFQYQSEFQYHFQYQSTTVQYNTIYICHIIISHYIEVFAEWSTKTKRLTCELKKQLVTTCHCLRSPGCGQKPQDDLGSGFRLVGHHGLNPFLQSLESGKPLFFSSREARNFSTHLRFGWYILVVTFLNHLVAVDGWYRWM